MNPRALLPFKCSFAAKEILDTELEELLQY
jgi:hypothetical protein